MPGDRRETRNRIKGSVRENLASDKFFSKYSSNTLDRMASKFSAMLAQDGVKDMMREITSPRAGFGTSLFGVERLGDLQKQRAPRTIGIDKLKQMRLDGQVALGLSAVKSPIVGALGEVPEVISDDPGVKAFVREALKKTWRSLVRSSLSAVDFGFQAHEKLFERRDIYWSWEAVEDGRTVSKERTLRDAWMLKRFKDLDPINVKIWINSESDSFAGFTAVQSSGGLGLGQKVEEKDLVPAWKAFVYTSGKEWGNLYGRPRLVPAYEPWYVYKALEFLSNRYFERFGEPGLKVGHDPKPSQNDVGTRETYPGKYAMQAAEAYKGSGVYTYPNVYDDDGNPLNTFEILTDDRRGDSWERILDFHLKRILRAILVPERVLTQDTKVGSLAMAQSHTDFFLLMLQEEIETFIEHVNLYIVPQLIKLNLDETGETSASLVAPDVTGENVELLAQLVDLILKEDESAREIVDTVAALETLNVPTKEVEAEEMPPVSEKPTSEGSWEFATYELQRKKEPRGEKRLDEKVEKLLKRVEDLVDKDSEPVKGRIYGYEDEMREAALKGLGWLKTDSEGRISKRGNARALAETGRKIESVGTDMRKWFRKDDGEQAQKYLTPFRELALDDFEDLAEFYGVSLPRGWKGNVRSEKLAKFGGGRESFLTNIDRIDSRESSKLREMLQEGADRGEVLDAVRNDDASVKELVSRMFDADARKAAAVVDTREAAAHLRAISGKVQKVPRLFDTRKLHKLETERLRKQRKAARLFRSRVEAKRKIAATVQKEAEKLAAEAADELKRAQVRAVEALRAEAALEKIAKAQRPVVRKSVEAAESAIRKARPSVPISDRIEAWKFNDNYVDLTSEAPARGAYRWALHAAARQSGFRLWKNYRNLRTEEIGGKPSAISIAQAGIVATLDWWNKEGEKEGSPEPLQLYGMHYGERSQWYPMPEEWAEEEGIEWKK